MWGRWWAWARIIISTHSASGLGETPPMVVMSTSESHRSVPFTWSQPLVSSCTQRNLGAAP